MVLLCSCAGACNCSESDATPLSEFSEEESETDLYRRPRNDPHRKSKESGYNSMVMSPLRGPNSIVEHEMNQKLSKAPTNSSLELTLDVDFNSWNAFLPFISVPPLSPMFHDKHSNNDIHFFFIRSSKYPSLVNDSTKYFCAGPLVVDILWIFLFLVHNLLWMFPRPMSAVN